MNREEMVAGIERLRPWFHRIELAPGIVTKSGTVAVEAPDHPLGTWEIIRQALPENLKGRTVLDVGCNAGFYSVEAKRRGAARVLGVDSQRHQVRQALFVKKALGLDIEFRRLSVYDLSLETTGAFDVVLALGLVYHLKHIVLGFERLFEVTKDLLIIETAVLPPADIPDVPFVCEVGGAGRPHHPVAYVENQSDDKEAVFNWFLPSPKATQAMMKDVGFQDVSIFNVKGDRAVLLGRKPPRSTKKVLAMLGAALEVTDGPKSAGVEADVRYTVKATNTGSSPWLAKGEPESGRGAVSLGAHLLAAGDDEVDWDAGRTGLAADVPPGKSVTLPIEIVSPGKPGKYVVELDLIAEQITWFEDLGSPTRRVELEVRPEPPAVPWYRAEAVLASLAAAGARKPAAGLSPFDSYRDLLERTTAHLAKLPLEEALRTLFLWTMGYEASGEAVADLTALVGTHPAGLKGAVRRLLSAPDIKTPPGPLAPEALAALAGRFGTPAPRPAPPGTAESFPGESALGRGLLAATAAQGDKEFVKAAYGKALGWEPDARGEANAVERLSGRAFLRPYLLRDLLWSPDLRPAAKKT